MQNFDEADLHGMQALAYRTLAEHEPAAAAQAQLHAKKALALRVDGHERSKIFDYLSLASACFIADDPEQADRYARMALLTDRVRPPPTAPGTGCARCTGSPAQLLRLPAGSSDLRRGDRARAAEPQEGRRPATGEV